MKEQLYFSQVAEPPHLSAYTDYREYLLDFFNYKKMTDSTPLRSYSYSTFSAAADIKSPNYLKLIIEGQRNLSDSMIKKFAKALQLPKKEQLEFEALVHYNQAKDPVERNQHLAHLANLRVNEKIKNGQIKQESYTKVSSWVSLALYALADQKGIDFDIHELKKILRGRASEGELSEALKKLLNTGELVSENGQVKKGRKLMQGSDDVPTDLVRKLQSELIYIGLEALFQEDNQNREFGAFTIALTEEEFEQLKFEVRQFRKRLYKDFLMKRESTQGDRVFQFNVQLFPVSERTKA